MFYFQIPIMLHKEFVHVNPDGEEIYKCGFKIGGGIDLDYTKSPQGYTDNVCHLSFVFYTNFKCKAVFWGVYRCGQIY